MLAAHLRFFSMRPAKPLSAHIASCTTTDAVASFVAVMGILRRRFCSTMAM